MKDKIQLFGGHKFRSAWDDKKEEWLFSVVDVVAALTESTDPKQYIKKMRARDPELNASWGTVCTLTALKAEDGKKYRTTAAPISGIFRIIQSIPSPKAEPIKAWLAKVGAERIDEEIDPQKAIDRARATYKAKGYSDAWIKQRIQGIQARNALTDEWKAHGVQDNQYALLTDIIHRGTFGVGVKQHKNIKGLKKENLRDNMTPLESALTTLAEVTATEITRSKNPETIDENKAIAKESGGIAARARIDVEKRTGRPVLSSENAKTMNGLAIEEDK